MTTTTRSSDLANDGLWAPRGRTAFWLAIVAATVNLTASLAMATLMRDATGVGGNEEHRMLWIAKNAGGVRAFWWTWELATISLTLTFATVLRSLDAPGTAGLRALSFVLIALGAIPDSINNLIGAEVLPPIAQAWAATREPSIALQFASWDRLSVVLTGSLANGLYAIGGWMLLAASLKNPRYPIGLCVLQVPLWLATSGMAVAAAIGSIPMLVVTVGVTMSTFVLWLYGTAFWWLKT